MQSYNELFLLWIVLFPLLGAVLNGVAGCFFQAERRVVVAVAVGSVALSFLLSAVSFFQLLSAGAETAVSYQIYEWFHVAIGAGGAIDVPVNVRFTMDALSGMMTTMITGIGLLIHIYSAGYMEEEPSYARFFSYLNLFTASMLVLVLASNLPLMFVGWEGVGLCSYLLIGFWFETPAYAAAGKKAFVVNRIGDFGVLMGMFLLLKETGSFEFAQINSMASSLTAGLDLGAGPMEVTVATVACLFLFLGCTGKSAQIPLFVWLPDAMAGPTPVSALIHAATMVTSGVYLCCRLSPVFVQSPTAMAVIAVTGTVTALVAASIALVQNELKKILAYSTVSQLGFMFAAVGVGAFGAGIFHVFTHAFFKACLFLGAGSVMHSVHAHGDAHLGKVGGLKRWLPKTHITFLLSCLAIAGFPGFSGFFSKDEILFGALTVGEYFEFAPWLGTAIFAGLVVAAGGTAFYMFRLYFLTFTGEYRGAAHDDKEHDDKEHGHAEPHESPASMTVPLLVLAAGATLVGFLGLPHWMGLHNLWGDMLHHSLAVLPGGEDHHAAATAGMTAMILGTASGIGGIALAFQKYRDKPWQPAQDLSALHQFLMDKWRVDEFYAATVIRATRLLAFFSGQIDRAAVDGLTKLAALTCQAGGWVFTRAQSGVFHAYGTAAVAGMAALTWWVMYPHPHVDFAVKDDAVRFVVGQGYGYEYRWDYESDGTFDSEWSSEREASHAFTAEDAHSFELVLTHTTALGLGPYRLRLREGVTEELNTRYFGGGWQTDPNDSRPPRATVKNGEVVIMPGAAELRVGREKAAGERVTVNAGSTIQFGGFAKMRVDTVVRSTVQVRSAFGNVRSATTDVAIQVGPSAQAQAGRRPGRALAQRVSR